MEAGHVLLHARAGQLLFVSSYFDYVRLRAFLKEQGVRFAGLSEYAEPKQAARGRSLFADGRLRLALLSERAHFYFRARVRGVKVCLAAALLYRFPCTNPAHAPVESMKGERAYNPHSLR